ncbi:MAG: PrsW family glutamic-type intramembrane protease [Bacteroidetes bacterium]|nr:PrsW family glutamic-type intramembrane protease [Bacteroidota bacterium]
MKGFLFYILPVAGVLFLAVNFFVGEPKFASLQEEADQHELVEDYSEMERAYRELIATDSFNIYYHYQFIQAHFNQDKEISHLIGAPDIRNDDSMFIFYNQYLKSDSIKSLDIGHFGLGLSYNKIALYDEAVTHYGAVKNRDLPYLNYLYGNLFSYVDTVRAKRAYLSELKNNGYVEGAYQNLGELYSDNIEALYALAKSNVGADHLSISLKRKAYFLKHDWSSYSTSVVSRFFLGFNVFGFAGAVLVLVVWLVYLLKIDFYQNKNIIAIALTLLLGMLFAFMTSYFTDYLKYEKSFYLNGGLLNDLLYCIVGIGCIEEMVKIIPFLIVLSFFKVIKEPIDYIIYAAISALGFSFIENIFYFDHSGLNRIQGRALSATVSHMFNTSLIAYFIVLGKSIRKYNVVVNFVVGFVLAAVFHGLYDFWLINQSVHSFSFLTFFQLLISMFVWTSMINNCINNSSKFESTVHYEPSVINDYLLYSLSFIFLFEYMVIAFEHGAHYANKTLLDDVLTGAFLLIFLTFSLSKFDIVRNYWAPLRFWDWETFRNTHRLTPYYFNVREILDKTIEINIFRGDSVLKEQMPMKGKIISRELISWEKDWYLVHLDKPVKIAWKEYDHVLVKTKTNSEVLLSKDNQVIQLRMVGDLNDLKRHKKVKGDFLLVDYALINVLQV